MQKYIISQGKPLSNWLILIFILAFSSCNITKPVDSPPPPTVTTATTDEWQNNLKSEFRKHYVDATKKHLTYLHDKYPVNCSEFIEHDPDPLQW